MAADAADIVDVGGESTRPGADRTSEAAELARVLPVVAELAAAGIRISVDTIRAGVAAAAIDAGASIVNDVSGGLTDRAMTAVVAKMGVPFGQRIGDRTAGRWARMLVTTTSSTTSYRNFGARVDALLTAGIAADRIVLDPGLGFAKTAEHNWELCVGSTC
jgi:dihydropteroate synthase